MKDWPYEAHPTGWYQIGYAPELAPGEVRPVQYFGEDLVLFRTADGEAALLDAYCPHLGSHLGHGGTVVGGCIECPWHGWHWAPDGTNRLIPYVDEPTHRTSIRSWEVREIDGIIITWYDALGRPPSWEWPGIPEFGDLEHFYPTHPHCSVFVGTRAVKPQSPLENIPDYEHFKFVHGAGEAAEPRSFDEDGHHLHATSSLMFGVGHESTWLTPNGPAECLIESEAWGLGLGLARMVFDGRSAAHLICVTPVDDELAELYSTVATTRESDDSGDEPTGGAKRLIAAQHAQIGNDFHIWENQRFVERPAYAGKEERIYARFRRWTEQFYPKLPAQHGEPASSESVAAD